jgi:hypothetical protein
MSSQVLTPHNTEATILARIIQAEDEELTPEAARYWLSRKLSLVDEKRVDELSAKAQAGSLTEIEKQELESYLRIGMLISTIQSKARQLLNIPLDRTWQ